MITVIDSKEIIKGDSRYPTKTLYKFLRIEDRSIVKYAISIEVDDTNREIVNNNMDYMPDNYSELQAIELWTEFKALVIDGCSIDDLHETTWEILLNSDGTINTTPNEPDWNDPMVRMQWESQ